MLTPNPEGAIIRKSILPEERYNATNFLTLWDFEGIFKYSPLFYGWYTNSSFRGYKLPFAYFVTGFIAYAYSFFAILRKMAENSRMSKLSEKDDECIFSWKLFTAWDYMIGNTETAHNRVASIVVGFKEALLEEAEKKKEYRNWKIIASRIFVNVIVLGLLLFSGFTVVLVVKRSTESDSTSTVWRRNEITVVMSLISIIFPMFFELLGFLEKYHPRKQLRIQLGRIMILNLLNLYSLIFALFDKISDMTRELEEFQNVSLIQSSSSFATTTPTISSNLQTYSTSGLICEEICNVSNVQSASNMMSSVAANLVVRAFPNIREILTTAATTILSENISDYTNGTETTTDFYENFTFLNNSSDYEDLTSPNNSSIWSPTNESFVNVNGSNLFQESDLKDAFVDYLTYVLHGLGNNDTNDQDTRNMTETSYLNFTEAVSDFVSTTMSTIFNISTTELDEYKRFDNNLSTLYENIASTLSTIEIRVERNRPNCTRTCVVPTTEIFSEEPFLQTTPMIFSHEASWNYTTRSRLRSLCWETNFGQELIKLTVMDLVMTVLSTLAMDFLRGIFVRLMNRCWCWDLEKVFPQYADFKVAENILHLVNNQGMVWMGMFFSPGLVVINIFKLYALMYLRAWTVLTCNVPHEIIFRASRSNNFYYALLLSMLFLCVLPVGYAIVRIKPSWHCGPFSGHDRIFHVFTKTIKRNVPKLVQEALDYIASPGIVIPLLVLLVLVIYYLISLTNSLREANNDLKIQLRRERTEERRKMFQMADKRRRGGSGGSGEFANTPFAKWKKLCSSMPGGKSFDDTPKQESYDAAPPIQEEKVENTRGKDFFSKLIKKALGKSSTSEEENPNNVDDGTDTEQHESLPEDVSIKETKPQTHQLSRTHSSSAFDFRKVATTALVQKKSSEQDIVEIDKSKHPKLLHRRDTLELRKNSKSTKPVAVSSKEMSQDSGSSIWSDNIPVIMISKTESTEYLDRSKDLPKTEDQGVKFKPKIKYALRKQSTEIDEDVICHFNNDIVKAAKLVTIESCKVTETAESENLEETGLPGPSQEDSKESEGAAKNTDTDCSTNISTRSESSNDTGAENSTDTVLNVRPNEGVKGEMIQSQKSSSNENSPETESSSEYHDNTSL